MSFPTQKRPFSAKVLDGWIRDLAESEGSAANRTRLGLSFVVVAAVLSRLREIDGTPLFILKGGVAMQLRFGKRARLSRDYDATFRRQILQHLESVLAQSFDYPIGGFRVRPEGRPEPLGPTGAFRQTLKITFNGRAWGEVRLEVSEAEGRSVELDTLDHLAALPDPTIFGLEGVDAIPAMSVPYQIAQKLHACTEVREGVENARFADLLDLQLLAELIKGDDWSLVHNACLEVFGLRHKHSWPPVVTVFKGWPEEYERAAIENAFPVTDVLEAAERVSRLITEIHNAPTRVRAAPDPPDA